MRLFCCLAGGIAGLAVAVAAGPAAADDLSAAEKRRCLTQAERAAAVAAKHALPLAQVGRARGAGELVRARLCESPKGLVYVLTVLGRDGKVTRVTVEAATGTVVGRR